MLSDLSMCSFFESNGVPTLSLQKVPNKCYLFDVNKKLKMVDLCGGGYPVPLTVGVDFAAPLLVHVGRVEWVKVSRYM